MGLLSTLKWKLTPADKKLAILKKRGLTIGEGCEILNGYELGSEPWLVSIGDNVRITGGVKITTHDGGCWVLRHKYPELADCDRFGRVTIGDNCVIGAGSVVTRDIPPNSFAAGVPCRVIRTLSDADSMKHKPEILADNEVIE